MNYLFVITSTINANIGVISNSDRYFQTLNTINSIKLKVPNSKIIVVDSSTSELSKKQLDDLSKNVDAVLVAGEIPQIKNLSSYGLKSHAETELMFIAFDFIKKMQLTDIARIFKISGRYELTDKFDISLYDNIDTGYVFKKQRPSWKNDESIILDTRLWSFSVNLLDEISSIYHEIYKSIQQENLDIEHAIAKHIDKNKLIELDEVGLKGIVASDGRTQYD